MSDLTDSNPTSKFIGTHALKKQWLETEKLGDKAYLGEDILTPQKKPKGGELTEAEKTKNRELSAKRIRVEHSVRRVKGFRHNASVITA